MVVSVLTASLVFDLPGKNFHTLKRFGIFFQLLVNIKEIMAIPIALHRIGRPRLLHVWRQFTDIFIEDGGSFQIVPI